MRFLARLASLVFLVAAVMAGVLDSIQSVAADQVILTPLAITILSASADLMPAIEAAIRGNLPDWAWDPLAVFILGQPAFAVFLVLSLAFWMAGYRKPQASVLAAI